MGIRSSRRKIGYELTRDILCRIRGREAASASLRNAIRFLPSSVKHYDNRFIERYLGPEMDMLSIAGYHVTTNHICVAMIVSEALTPELILDVAASENILSGVGDTSASLQPYHLNGYYTSMAAFIINEKLKRRVGAPDGLPTLANDLPVRDGAMNRKQALAIRDLTARLADPNSGTVENMRDSLELDTDVIDTSRDNP